MTPQRWKRICRNRIAALASRQRKKGPQEIGFKVLSTMKDYTGSILIPDDDQGDTAEATFSAFEIPVDLYEEIIRRRGDDTLTRLWHSTELGTGSVPRQTSLTGFRDGIAKEESEVKGMDRLRQAFSSQIDLTANMSSDDTSRGGNDASSVPFKFKSTPDTYSDLDVPPVSLGFTNQPSVYYDPAYCPPLPVGGTWYDCTPLPQFGGPAPSTFVPQQTYIPPSQSSSDWQCAPPTNPDYYSYQPGLPVTYAGSRVYA